MGRDVPAAAAAAAANAQQGQAGGSHPGFTFRPNLPPVEQSASFNFVEGMQQQQQMGRHMQQELRLMHQQQHRMQQQQQQQHAIPLHEDYSDSASVTSSMQHSQVALLHEHVPPAPQPAAAAAGRVTAGRPPREFIPGPAEPSAPAAAAAAQAGQQYPTEHIPGSAAASNAAGYSGPTETPTPDYIAAPVPVVVDPTVPRLHFKKPLQRVPLFVREIVGPVGTKKRAVASYTPANLQLGELFEVSKHAIKATKQILLPAVTAGVQGGRQMMLSFVMPKAPGNCTAEGK
jgi:hypothetical protein